MPKHASLIAAAIVAALAAPAVAQQPSPPAFEKKEFTHSAWTKGIFSEAVTVKGAGRMIFLAGVGSEDENGPRGNVRHHNDLGAQCEYAFDKIKRVLAAHGANMNHVVKDHVLSHRHEKSRALWPVPDAELRDGATSRPHPDRCGGAGLS
jgi:enamine deaminase RidA (YjgF/YER057c/UK114 family)